MVLIYTGSCGESAMSKVQSLSMGVMLSGVKVRCKPPGGVPVAVDNGAFEAWRCGRPWLESRFLRLLNSCWDRGIVLDFVVVPDIVAAGPRSLAFSLSWVDRLQPARLALVVQDGIGPIDIQQSGMLDRFSVLFVGGSVEWKWNTARGWINFAHAHSLRAHIGRCGTLETLRRACDLGADSVDSASICRNDSFHIIESFNGATVVNLFDKGGSNEAV